MNSPLYFIAQRFARSFPEGFDGDLSLKYQGNSTTRALACFTLIESPTVSYQVAPVLFDPTRPASIGRAESDLNMSIDEVLKAVRHG